MSRKVQQGAWEQGRAKGGTCFQGKSQTNVTTNRQSQGLPPRAWVAKHMTSEVGLTESQEEEDRGALATCLEK